MSSCINGCRTKIVNGYYVFVDNKYLWHDGKFHLTACISEDHDYYNQGYYYTREEAEEALAKYEANQINWLTREYIEEQASKGDKEALECSIKHWQQIVDAGHDAFESAEDEYKVSMCHTHCALCTRYKDILKVGCRECPLGKAGQRCISLDSAWDKASMYTEDTFEEVTNNMLETLKSFRVKERIYQIGDIVKVGSFEPSPCLLFSVTPNEVVLATLVLPGYRRGEPFKVNDLHEIKESEIPEKVEYVGRFEDLYHEAN